MRTGDVDLVNGVICVEFGWEYRGGQIPLKSNAVAARCRFPRCCERVHGGAVRRDRLQRRRPAVRLRVPRRPIRSSNPSKRADQAWKAAGLERITLHECRHTFASLMIAAGVNPKALQHFMSDANISITLDRYGHLMPGSETEAAHLLDAYLHRRAHGK